MGSTLSVTHLRGLTSGSNANEILVDSGHDLIAPGHVIQVKQLTNSSTVQVTTAGWTNGPSGLHLQITPKSSSSKVLVMYNIWGILYGGSKHLTWDLTRTVGGVQSSRFGGGTYGLGSVYTGGITETQLMCHIEYLDSPNTTSTITYIPQFNNINTGSSASFGNSSRTSTITAMEIAQ